MSIATTRQQMLDFEPLLTRAQGYRFTKRKSSIWTREVVPLRKSGEVQDFLKNTDSLWFGDMRVSVVTVPTEKTMFFEHRDIVLGILGFSDSLHLERNHATSSTGRLLVGREEALFETPWHGDTYLYASAVKVIDIPSRDQRRVLFVYDTAKFGVDEFWNRFHEDEPKRGILGLLSIWLAETYLRHVKDKATLIHDDLERINLEIEKAARIPMDIAGQTSSSKFMYELNRCSNDVRETQLDEEITFAFESIRWANGLASGLAVRHRLTLSRFQCEKVHPTRLKDRIKQIRSRNKDLIIQRQQEREEAYQARAAQRQSAEDTRLSNEKAAETARQEAEDKRQKDSENLMNLSIQIAQDAQRDSSTMRGIAWVTMGFLPATFVSSFFGMNFFNGIAGPVPFDEASRNVWVFFVVALPVSAVVLGVFWWWDDNNTKELHKQRTSTQASHFCSSCSGHPRQLQGS
jgi:hypothetical protein